jgi:hypothetical protein
LEVALFEWVLVYDFAVKFILKRILILLD